MSAADREANSLAYKARDLIDNIDVDKLTNELARQAWESTNANLYDLIQFTEED